MDRDTIISEARRILGEPSTGGYWDSTDWANVVARAQDDFAIRTRCLKTYATFTTTASTAEYDFSESSLANFIDIDEVRYYIDSNVYYTIPRVSRTELEQAQGNYTGATGTPNYYCFENRVLEFDCYTEASKTVRVYYHKLPTTLSAGTDVPIIPTKHHQALVYYLAWKFCESDDTRTDKLMYYKNEYFQEVEKATLAIENTGSTYGRIKDDTNPAVYGY